MKFARIQLKLDRAFAVAAIASLFVVAGSLPAAASHFRGGALVPSIDAFGVLTVDTVTFWRPAAVDCRPVSVPGVSMSQIGPTVLDTTDGRFTACNQIFQGQLPGPGTYSISASSCCRVGGIINANQSSWTMNSTIVWDGVNATTPIFFNFSGIQIEVPRDQDYVDQVGALAGPGLTLTYDQALNQNIYSQPPGFTIDPSSGAMFIPQAIAATYQDNPTANIGADYAFSGNIFASDGSQVEFDWMFDAVDTCPVGQDCGNHTAPEVDDAVVIVEVGDLLEFTMTGVDTNSPLLPLTWDFPAFLGAGANFEPTFDPLTQLFSWDTIGSFVGTYSADIRANNMFRTDTGTLTIHLVDDFDPFGGVTRTRSRNTRLRPTRPSSTTDGVRCVETSDPTMPDFTEIPFEPFANGEVDIDLELSAGGGVKTVCCQFIESTGQISNPICEEIELQALDHFKCYDTDSPDLDVIVALTDESGSQAVFLEEAEFVCNPVDKNGEGIIDADAHLVCFEVDDDVDEDLDSDSDVDTDSDTDHEAPARSIQIENQFGIQELTVRETKVLCTPSRLFREDVPDRPDREGRSRKFMDRPSLRLDHFRCYEAEGASVNVRVDLVDEFGFENILVEDPELFCSPVDKNGEGIIDPDGRLTCYEIEDEMDFSALVTTENQFGLQILTLEEGELLCVPSQELESVELEKVQSKPAVPACGIGIELVFVVAPLFWLYQRRRRPGLGTLNGR